MTPPRLDRDQSASRLRMLSDALDDLRLLIDVDEERLLSEPLTRAAAERLLQVAVDLAVDLNGHIAVAATGRAPETGRASFAAAARTGALDIGLAERLAPAASLRNVLVHRYLDIDVGIVARAVPEVVDGFAEYVRQVAAYLDESRPASG